MEGARFRASEKGRHELNQPPARIIKTIFSGALIGALVLGSSAPGAHAQGLDHADSTLSQFRGNLTSASDIAAYDALTKRQRAELASYLNGETDPVSQLSTSEPQAGDFELRSGATASAPSATAVALAPTRTVSAWQAFLFAGITISKTTVRETYYYSGAKATKIASYSCVVNMNYDPFAEVSAKKAGAWISAGKAIAECKVTVKRGAPTPWGQITWSTASRIQYVAGDGHGTRTSHGWR